jgi:hypothetical protein
MFAVLLFVIVAVAQRDTVMVSGQRRWVERDANGQITDVINPGISSRDDQRLTHLAGSDRGGWVPRWLPRWGKRAITVGYHKYNGLKAR